MPASERWYMRASPHPYGSPKFYPAAAAAAPPPPPTLAKGARGVNGSLAPQNTCLIWRRRSCATGARERQWASRARAAGQRSAADYQLEDRYFMPSGDYVAVCGHGRSYRDRERQMGRFSNQSRDPRSSDNEWYGECLESRRLRIQAQRLTKLAQANALLVDLRAHGLAPSELG